jgi:putative sterol carrier protein
LSNRICNDPSHETAVSPREHDLIFLSNRVVKMIRASLSLLSATIVTAVCIGATIAAATEPSNTTPQGVFDGMRQSFQAEKAKGVHARYQWELSGPNGGQWWIEVNDGTYKIGKGKIADPNVTFIAKDKDWVAICHDQLSGTWAYLVGRLKVRGDQGVARKLGEIFP